MGEFGRSFRRVFPSMLGLSKNKRLQGIPERRLRGTLSEKELCRENDRYIFGCVLEKWPSLAAFIKDVGM